MNPNEATMIIRNAILVAETALENLEPVRENRDVSSRLLSVGMTQIELGLLALEEDLRDRGHPLSEKPEYIKARENKARENRNKR